MHQSMYLNNLWQFTCTRIQKPMITSSAQQKTWQIDFFFFTLLLVLCTIRSLSPQSPKQGKFNNQWLHQLPVNCMCFVNHQVVEPSISQAQDLCHNHLATSLSCTSTLHHQVVKSMTPQTKGKSNNQLAASRSCTVHHQLVKPTISQTKGKSYNQLAASHSCTVHHQVAKPTISQTKGKSNNQLATSHSCIVHHQLVKPTISRSPR